MRARFENLLFVTPETFFGTLFFDEQYNQGLYRELGFKNYEVLTLEQGADGSVTRSLRGEPPLSIPSVIKRRLNGRVHYTESGVFDARSQRWRFETVPSLAAEQVRITGEITLAPHAQGALHVCEVELDVSAFGLGSLIERVIERNTRESYRINTRYTNAYATARGLLAPGAPR